MYVSQTSRAGVPLWIASCTRWQESSPNKPREGLKQLSPGCRESCGASLCRRSLENPRGRRTPAHPRAHPRHRPARPAPRSGARHPPAARGGEGKGVEVLQRSRSWKPEGEADPPARRGAVRCGAKAACGALGDRATLAPSRHPVRPLPVRRWSPSGRICTLGPSHGLISR